MTSIQARARRITTCAIWVVAMIGLVASSAQASTYIGDLVFCDTDANGIYDPTDTAIDGVDVRIGGETDLGAKLNISINGVDELIHTSCSVDYVALAPAPLDGGTGCEKGDPSSLWFVESFEQK